MENDPDYFRENYDDALRQICTTKEDLGHLAKLLKPHLPRTIPDHDRNWSRYYEAKERLMLQAHILKRLGETAQLLELLRKHASQDKELKSLYIKYLKKRRT